MLIWCDEEKEGAVSVGVETSHDGNDILPEGRFNNNDNIYILNVEEIQ